MLRFTIRDMLWLMVVLGMAVAWWLQAAKHRAVVRDNYFTLDDINSSGIWVDYYNRNRVLLIKQDKRGYLEIAPVQR